MSEDREDKIRQKQRSRALVTALLLGALVVLFYFVTLARIGGGG